MTSILMAIAMLCQATPGTTSTGGGYLYTPQHVRASQAECQIRVLKCTLDGALKNFNGPDIALQKCVLDGKVKDL